jgi:phosphohistidine phosphatase
MRTLLVMRHAKSDWGAAFPDDHERPLALRGIKAAQRMGRFLTDSDASPELVISSTAVRALQTVELASEAAAWECPVITEAGLYASDPEKVLEIIRMASPEVGRLLIAGHEPTGSALVALLIGGGRVTMPTAAVACLDMPHGEWVDLGRGTCELRWLVTPKMLKKE